MTHSIRRGAGKLAPDSPSASYLGWVYEDREAIAAAIREQIAAEVPLFAGLSGDVGTVLRNGVDTALAAFITNDVEHSRLNRKDLAPLQAVGEAAAEADVPLDALTGCIGVAARVVRDWPTRRDVQLLDRDAFLAFSERTTTFANTVSSAILRAYTTKATECRATRRQAEFWQAVVTGALDGEADIAHEAAVVGCDLASPWALVVCLPAQRGSLERAITAGLAGAVAFAPSAADDPGHVVVAIPTVGGSARLAARLRAVAESEGTVLAFVGPSDRPLALRQGYRILLPLLDRLDALTAGPTVVSAEDLAPAAVLATVPVSTAAAFASGLLAGVDRQSPTRARKWLATIDALVHNDASPKSAAKALAVSEKTVRRRMSAIQKEAGLALDSFDGLYQMRMAMTLRKLSCPEDSFVAEKCPNETPRQTRRPALGS